MTDTQQTVLITGATDGLGKAMALLLAQRGYRVFAAGRSADKRAELDRLAAAKRLPLETLHLDVCDDASVQSAVQSVLHSAGSLDILINNAGVAYVATIEDLNMDDWHRQFETNFFGAVRVTQAVLPHMRQRRKGRIVLLSSIVGLITVPAQGAYCATKHALEALGDALRLELHPFGIQTILIEPGYIVTGIQHASRQLAMPYEDKMRNGPYTRLYSLFIANAKEAGAKSRTTPEDCAHIVARAIESPNPAARYTVTPVATAVKYFRRLLPDSAFDSLFLRRFGLADRA